MNQIKETIKKIFNKDGKEEKTEDILEIRVSEEINIEEKIGPTE